MLQKVNQYELTSPMICMVQYIYINNQKHIYSTKGFKLTIAQKAHIVGSHLTNCVTRY